MHARWMVAAVVAAGLCAAAAAWRPVELPWHGDSPPVPAVALVEPARQAKALATLQAAQATALRAPGAAAAPSDVEGDGRSDILLDHVATGAFAYWQMQGPQVVRMSPVLGAEGYRRVATGDFNGDGRVDVLWAHTYDPGRELLMWLADGNGGFVAAPVARTALYWQVLGAGDVDGDGKSDILLRADDGALMAYWAMDGATIVRQPAAFALPEGLALVAQGDFNGDRRLDLVWEEPASRALWMWFGTSEGFAPAPVRDYAPGWKVWGAGDIDGDGRSDLLLTHPSYRLFAYWIMHDATPVRYSPAFRLSGEEEPVRRFGPVAVGDYNGDGKLDILSSRERDRALVIWFGDGDGFIAWPTLSHAEGWRVARSFGSEGAPVRPYVHSDANGDGKSDFFVLGMVTRPPTEPGAPELVTENGWNYFDLRDGLVSLGVQANPDLGGLVLATGDFDGDVRADVVIEKHPDGQGIRRTVIRLSSGVPQYEVEIPTPATGWRILAAGDVDGDGLSDLLLGEGAPLPELRGYAVQTENPEMQGFAYWIMARGGVVGRYSVGFRVDPATPRLAARGDFDGDGRLDLVWGSASGSSEHRLVQWLGDGNGFGELGFANQDGPVEGPAEGWQVFGAGDINGDARSDLLLQQSASASNHTWAGLAYWIMDRNAIRAYSPGFALSAQDRVSGDYNGDGLLDFVMVGSATTRNPRYLFMAVGDGSGFQLAYVGFLCCTISGNNNAEMIFNR